MHIGIIFGTHLLTYLYKETNSIVCKLRWIVYCIRTLTRHCQINYIGDIYGLPLECVESLGCITLCCLCNAWYGLGKAHCGDPLVCISLIGTAYILSNALMGIGKQRALSLEVTCNFRLYLKIGWTSVKPSWKHRLFTSNYRCLHTGVPYITT